MRKRYCLTGENVQDASKRQSSSDQQQHRSRRVYDLKKLLRIPDSELLDPLVHAYASEATSMLPRREENPLEAEVHILRLALAKEAFGAVNVVVAVVVVASNVVLGYDRRAPVAATHEPDSRSVEEQRCFVGDTAVHVDGEEN